MTSSFIFDSVEIPGPRITGRVYTPNLHLTVRSMTPAAGDLTNIKAKRGTFSENVVAGGLVSTKGTATLGTLTGNGETFTAMRIVNGSYKEYYTDNGGHVEYELTFAQDTTAS